MQDIGLLGYFSGAGLIVKLVMLFLIALSVFSWTVIFQRGFYIKKLKSKVEYFEAQFWSGVNLSKLYTTLNEPQMQEGLSGIFFSGFKEFTRLSKQSGAKSEETLSAVQRAMRIAQEREINRLENHLPFLASVSSVSPYIGLFGTVLGIMTVLHTLGNVQHATISMVAPGISEALIATAMGLFAAIPSLLAYNRFTTDARKISSQYDLFREEFLNILQHQVGK
jgi:biopolymer transport protein TolQ